MRITKKQLKDVFKNQMEAGIDMAGSYHPLHMDQTIALREKLLKVLMTAIDATPLYKLMTVTSEKQLGELFQAEQHAITDSRERYGEGHDV